MFESRHPPINNVPFFNVDHNFLCVIKVEVLLYTPSRESTKGSINNACATVKLMSDKHTHAHEFWR